MTPYQGLNTTGPQARQLLQALMLANRRKQLQQARPPQGYSAPYTNQGITMNAPGVSAEDASASAGPSSSD